jgi:hypothetical protein
MPQPQPIREILEAIGLAMRRELVRLLDESGRQPLRTNSALKKQLLSDEAVKVNTVRGKSGRFEGYTASSSLTLYAQDYLQWIDSGRKPFAKKVPLSAIIQFIKDRNLRLRDKKTGRFSRKTYRGRERSTGQFVSINRLAFMIQNAIYRRGISPRRVIAPAFALGEAMLEQFFDDGMLDNLSLDIEKTLGFIK